MGATEQEKDQVAMEKYGCKFSELKDPQERQSVGGTIGGRMRAGDMVNRSDDPADHGTGGASEEDKDKVAMEKYGCKFSELKDPQERQSVGGTIGGRMRQAAMTTQGGQEGEQQQEGAEGQGQ
ncbi:hypothetical protein CHLRE_03g166150v5 [Chlamydomonas reinhardtii]|uniref:Uncharacterized protein n=1 Tax=Chlamydomonas reinhardtii TaxID=3055 RepID=A0A2K3DWR5_CHLRE|nr:uncharacterized protein CHLRE_03g166150v5 [Chlamydomonas reinhardtii]PNW84969.1 hypothetical protein CHLRE_03g166150v5 [Chlamydomonas reinhardtii]